MSRNLSRSKIDWCDYTWGPVWGCNRGCKYCYARGMARRFAGQIYKKEEKYLYRKNGSDPDFFFTSNVRKFKPIWIESGFDKEFPKKPSTIFVGSMTDIFYWKIEWMDRVLEKISKYPEHIFIFLTKEPIVYEKYDFHLNCWLGATLTSNDDECKGGSIVKRQDYVLEECKSLRNEKNIHFLNIEPMLGPIHDRTRFGSFDWLIIGAQTGNLKDKVVPEMDWIVDVAKAARDNGMYIFIKDNMCEIIRNYGFNNQESLPDCLKHSNGPDGMISKEFPVYC